MREVKKKNGTFIKCIIMLCYMQFCSGHKLGIYFRGHSVAEYPAMIVAHQLALIATYSVIII